MSKVSRTHLNLLLSLAALAATVGAGGMYAAQAAPVLESVSVTPAGWAGYALYERVEFTCHPQWDDGIPDPDCTRAGTPPVWSALELGAIESGTNAPTATWNSGHGAGSGMVQVVYGGLTGAVPVAGTMPTDEEYPLHYHTYPDIFATEDSRNAFYGMTEGEWEAYYSNQSCQAHTLSSNLETYVRSWLAGEADADLPDGLLPASIENEKTADWALCRPEDVTAGEQWFYRHANEVPDDFSELYFLGPDNHCTYARCVFVAPLGSRLIIDGEFPHCRFMCYEILPPFDPRNPTTSGFGAPEVPIVDVDIDPLPGHTNPFRPGADRTASNRRYRVVFELAEGNARTLNPQAMADPVYRAPGNMRVGGPFAPSGPEGDGALVASVLWLRYYAADHGLGPLAGVPLPKAFLELPTGETFWLKCDFSLTEARWNKSIPGYTTLPLNPIDATGPTMGWFKMFGIWLSYAEGEGVLATEPWGIRTKEDMSEEIRTADRVLFGRGAELPPPGNSEVSATACHYNSYLLRPIPLGLAKVIVVTGKLPTTPQTRDGQPVMTTAEARYACFTHTGSGEDGRYRGLLYGGLMDDEIVLDGQRRYIIAYSRDGLERPANAVPAAGVTWQNWGPEALQILTVRWMSVMPDWHLPGRAPHQDLVPWETGAWSQTNYNSNLVGKNCQGVMGEYHPIIHYMTKGEFEALGNPITFEDIPAWDTGIPPPQITAFECGAGRQVSLTWEAVQEVWVDFTGDLLPEDPEWITLDGPITTNTWDGEVPEGYTRGFIRIRGPCPSYH